MGPYLSTPKKEKESMDGENAKVIIISTLYHLNFILQLMYGATGMQGWRNTMEDTHIVELDLG